MFELRILVVDLEDHGPRATQALRNVVVAAAGPCAGPLQSREPTPPDLLLEMHLAPQVEQIGDESHGRETGEPPHDRRDDQGERRRHDRGDQQAENGPLTEFVSRGAGDRIGVRVESAAAPALRCMCAHGLTVGCCFVVDVGLVGIDLRPVVEFSVHAVLRGGAVRAVTTRTPMRIAAVPGGRPPRGDRLVVSAVQNSSCESGVGRLPDSRTLRDQHGHQNEQPHGNEPDPQKRVRHPVVLPPVVALPARRRHRPT